MRKVSLFQYHFIANATIDEIVKEVVAGAPIRKQLIVTPNAYILQLLAKPIYSPLREYAQRADYVLPDGIPIVWLSKLKDKKDFISKRLTGSDLFPRLWTEIKNQGFSATIIASNEDISKSFLADYPEKCNTFVPDFFSESDDKYVDFIAQETIKKIITINSNFLFIGISDPKQTLISKRINEILSEQNEHLIFTTALLGASFEFYFGKAKRAPKWVQEYGIEWLYRFAQEPKRLWKRYTIDNFRFLALAFKDAFKK